MFGLRRCINPAAQRVIQSLLGNTWWALKEVLRLLVDAYKATDLANVHLAARDHITHMIACLHVRRFGATSDPHAPHCITQIDVWSSLGLEAHKVFLLSLTIRRSQTCAHHLRQIWSPYHNAATLSHVRIACDPLLVRLQCEFDTRCDCAASDALLTHCCSLYLLACYNRNVVFTSISFSFHPSWYILDRW